MPRVLILANTLPEPDTTAAGVHMVQLIGKFRTGGWDVHFASTSMESEHPYSLEADGVTLHPIKLNDPASEAFFKELKPEVVVFDRFFLEEQFSWQVADAVPDAIRILNTEDLHSLRDYRKAFLKEETGTWIDTDLALREIAAIYRSDLTLVTSFYEMKVLQIEPRVPDIQLLWHPIKVGSGKSDGMEGFNNREHIVYMGNGRHQPNIDGLNRLLDTLWPKIRKKLPNTELHVYGAYWPEVLQQRCKKTKGVVFKGWARDKNEVFDKARISVAPMRYGAGIKGKVLDSMATGCPVVMSPLAAEGIAGEFSLVSASGKQKPFTLIAKTDKEFIDTVIRLYNEPESWSKAQEACDEILEPFCEFESFLLERIREISQNLPTHRSMNIMGRILQHQAYAATRYLSKWIQEKQQNQPAP